MDDIKLSKFLSLILRHSPDKGNITLDENGWSDVNILLTNLNRKGFLVTKNALNELVANNDKQRFIFNDTKTKIRANQGHSVTVDLKLTPLTPPSILYHGTVYSVLDLIKKTGLSKMKRHHVHLSEDVQTATKVGSRRGNPIILEVEALEMHNDGYVFYKSDNNVWLTDDVPFKYIIL